MLPEMMPQQISATTRTAVCRRFPALSARDMNHGEPLGLDHVYRRALLVFLAECRPEADATLLEEVRTWGDVDEWFGAALASGEPRAPYDDQRYAGRTTALRPLAPEHVDPLYRSTFDPRWSHRWRFRGRSLSFEAFGRELFNGVHVQFAVVDRASESTFYGLVVGYNADLGNGHMWMGFQKVAGDAPRDAMTEAAMLFIQYCFNHWELRKIYFEVPGYNMKLFGGMAALGLAVEEGRLVDFYFHDGVRHDQVILSVSRGTWCERLSNWFTSSARGVDES